MNATSSNASSRSKTDFSVRFGLIAVLMFFVASGLISYLNTRTLSRNTQWVTHTHEVIIAIGELISLLKDAETGQRGYIITGSPIYLEPYQKALPQIETQLDKVEFLTRDNPEQQVRIGIIKKHLRSRLQELQRNLELRTKQGLKAAQDSISEGKGLREMQALRFQFEQMREEEQQLRDQRLEEMRGAYRIAVVSGILAGLLGVVLSGAVAYLVRRATINRRKQEWLQSGEVGLSAAMFGEQRVEQLGDSILLFLAKYFDAHAGAFFTREGGYFRRVSTYGVPAESNTIQRFELGDGLLGEAAKTGEPLLVRDVPEGYLALGSGLGQGVPRHLLIAPASADGSVNAVLELGFIHPLDDNAIQLLTRVSDMIGVAVRSANYRANLQNLLEETQRQAEELQSQSEELRVNNEELEEQSRALRESQARLEQQQAELEQTNAQLEEQAQQLEGQRDDISRAKAAVQLKARELEQASQYKSDFLANMSHELRTPLNSSLILAKLLADNPAGNLTAEQVKFAQTIQSAGNDLLALINDILDLSKIEAGHMEVHSEPVTLARMVEEFTRGFEAFAELKNLRLDTHLVEGVPPMIETDRQRLEQILKNLMSNAIKFTEQGSVTLSVHAPSQDTIAFAVTDTGIGIAPEHVQSVFEAFRQADGTISRKYGGTGLGLSISRELARLLGGQLELESVVGKGSTFTLILPRAYDPELVSPRHAVAMMEELPAPTSKQKTPPRDKKAGSAAPRSSHAPRAADDREKLTGNSRVILVIEDDMSFARILYDLAHELDFQCLIASTAEEALALAMQFLPSAVVLDVGLPDNSGLSVLDRLKRDARTRHIPVHVVSAGDYAQTALSLGAVGYMLKPVKREELTDTLKSLETRLEQRMRRVLIVEDDAVQLESLRKLLGSHEVETVGARTASDCLKLLKKQTFDCMVLDLSLPDASGYSLLETLSKEDKYAFPPVIVYTGRDLSKDEEQRLRKYSKSIIIKGAKSPERLLDEVTLFLHQVVADLPAEQQRMLEKARNRDAVLEGRRILVVEDDIRNVYALNSVLEPKGALVQIARNGREALDMLEASQRDNQAKIDLVLMDVMMPEMDGLTATREIRKRKEWKKLPVIMLTAKAMKDDQERCLEAGANDYMAKPLDVEKLLSLVRVWMPR